MKTMMTWRWIGCLAACLCGVTPEARAEDTLVSNTSTAAPRVLHLPPPVAPAGEMLSLRAEVEQDWALQRVWVAISPSDEAKGPFARLLSFEELCEESVGALRVYDGSNYCVLPMLRVGVGYEAQVPGALMQPPAMRYFIGSVDADGMEREHFGSPDQPSTVLIRGESEATELDEKLARHKGNRSSFALRVDTTFFGERRQSGGPSGSSTDDLSDRYGVGLLEYTYRLLGTIYDIRIGIGIERGRVSTVGDEPVRERRDSDGDVINPGINYGYSAVNFEFHRLFSTQLGLLFGASADGFSVGVEGLLRIGPQFSTHLALGLQGLQDMGGRYWLSFHWETVPYVPLTWTLELTERPGSDDDRVPEELGVRVMLDADLELGDHVMFGLRAGYATRLSSLSAGFVLGMNTVVEF